MGTHSAQRRRRRPGKMKPPHDFQKPRRGLGVTDEDEHHGLTKVWSLGTNHGLVLLRGCLVQRLTGAFAFATWKPNQTERNAPLLFVTR
jgi:hypothetical protein